MNHDEEISVEEFKQVTLDLNPNFNLASSYAQETMESFDSNGSKPRSFIELYYPLKVSGLPPGLQSS